MALRVRDNGDILCAATHPKQKGDIYIPDDLHYQMAVVERVIVPDENEKENGIWYWNDFAENDKPIDYYFPRDRRGGVHHPAVGASIFAFILLLIGLYATCGK